ncbi:hypothetical protein ACR30L_09430 [Psychromonas sp. PT13]|uniref:hypothetical protein n=1 Tax=Psychromonas sp. PT13 TaxID=3439547 RepID=UPI003EBE522A
MPSHTKIHEAYLLKSESVMNDASFIALNNANSLLYKSKIVNRLAEMEKLNDNFKSLDSKLRGTTENCIRISGELLQIGLKRKDCYDGFADDLIMFAAFEQYMKSYLLRKGYVVHVIDRNKSLTTALANKQNKKPIHINDLTDCTVFKMNSIDATTLLSTKYLELLNPSSNVIEGLDNLKSRRNRTHFDAKISSISYYEPCFFETFQFIKMSIEQDVECYINQIAH